MGVIENAAKYFVQHEYSERIWAGPWIPRVVGARLVESDEEKDGSIDHLVAVAVKRSGPLGPSRYQVQVVVHVSHGKIDTIAFVD